MLFVFFVTEEVFIATNAQQSTSTIDLSHSFRNNVRGSAAPSSGSATVMPHVTNMGVHTLLEITSCPDWYPGAALTYDGSVTPQLLPHKARNSTQHPAPPSWHKLVSAGNPPPAARLASLPNIMQLFLPLQRTR